MPTSHRFVLYGGKSWDNPGAQYRDSQFIWEWFNTMHDFDGTTWVARSNTSIDLPCTALEEPVACWDSARSRTVLLGLSHDGRCNTDENPRKHFQDTPQQTYEINGGFNLPVVLSAQASDPITY